MRNFLTKDLGWKLFSLALAVVTWFAVDALSRDPRRLNRPLEPSASLTFQNVSVLVVSAAADVREFKVNPDVVQVTVRGRPDVVNRLQKGEIHVTVDLTGIESARNLRKQVDVSVPPEITVVSVVPKEVDVVVPPKAKSSDGKD
jgi:hypothetical protein